MSESNRQISQASAIHCGDMEQSLLQHKFRQEKGRGPACLTVTLSPNRSVITCMRWDTPDSHHFGGRRRLA